MNDRPPPAPVAEADARPARRLLFLDDDPARAEAFLAEHPEAVWVQTVPECLGRLAEPWDEVHLDHDLGGETYVEIGRDDCGMEVVRWLCREPRPHLRPARFVLHSWNEQAAFAMALELFSAGYEVWLQPFGHPGPGPDEEAGPEAGAFPCRRPGWMSRLGSFARGLLDRAGRRRGAPRR